MWTAEEIETTCDCEQPSLCQTKGAEFEAGELLAFQWDMEVSDENERKKKQAVAVGRLPTQHPVHCQMR